MIGFEISINGREPIVAASDYFVFADLTFGCSSGRIKIKGSDGLHYLTWLTEKLEEGDRVLIKMVVTDKVSPVLVNSSLPSATISPATAALQSIFSVPLTKKTEPNFSSFSTLKLCSVMPADTLPLTTFAREILPRKESAKVLKMNSTGFAFGSASMSTGCWFSSFAR